MILCFVISLSVVDLKAPEKKVAAERLLPSLNTDKFSDLSAIGKLITDFTEEAQPSASGMHYFHVIKLEI